MAESAVPDLGGARCFVEARPPGGSEPGDQWLLTTSGAVVYQRPGGELVYPAQVPAAALLAGTLWREVA